MLRKTEFIKLIQDRIRKSDNLSNTYGNQLSVKFHSLREKEVHADCLEKKTYQTQILIKPNVFELT